MIAWLFASAGNDFSPANPKAGGDGEGAPAAPVADLTARLVEKSLLLKPGDGGGYLLRPAPPEEESTNDHVD